MKELIKKNLKLIIAFGIVIVIAVVGVTYSLMASNFNPIGVTGTAGNIGINIEYLNGSSSNIENNGGLVPVNINNGLENVDPNNIIKIEFNLSGVASNPNNAIYDIVLRNIEIDCELKKPKFNWRLYKNDEELNSGTFAPTFDSSILNEDDNGIIDRYVLTNTQEDLTMETNKYTLYMWISETCKDYSLAECLQFNSIEQSQYGNKHFSATMKIEVSTGTKKELTRESKDVDVCNAKYSKHYADNQWKVQAPDGCETYNIDTSSGLVYNGTTKMFITPKHMNQMEEPVGFEIIGNYGVEAGTYNVVARLQDGYVWKDGTKKDKIYTCIIGKRPIIIRAQNQTVTKGSDIDKDSYNVSGPDGAVAISGGQYISSLNLYANTYKTGTSEIVPSGAVILDQYGKDVTSNYDITYENGILTVEE